MTSRKLWCATCAVLLLATGCESQSSAPPASTARVIPGPAQNPNAGMPPAANPEAAAGGAPQNTVPGAGHGVPAAATFPLRLSAGTALAQTGPEGVVMGFSVDYQATGYQPSSGVRYVLVIEAGGGKRIEQAVEVTQSGTWTLLVPGLPPEAGPFQAHVEAISAEGSRQTLSAAVPLQ